MPTFKKQRKHYFKEDVARLTRLLEAHGEKTFEYLQEGYEDSKDLSDEELLNLPSEKLLHELGAKSTVLLFESSSRLEKLTWVLISLTVILAILTAAMILRAR